MFWPPGALESCPTGDDDSTPQGRCIRTTILIGSRKSIPRFEIEKNSREAGVWRNRLATQEKSNRDHKRQPSGNQPTLPNRADAVFPMMQTERAQLIPWNGHAVRPRRRSSTPIASSSPMRKENCRALGSWGVARHRRVTTSVGLPPVGLNGATIRNEGKQEAVPLVRTGTKQSPALATRLRNEAWTVVVRQWSVDHYRGDAVMLLATEANDCQRLRHRPSFTLRSPMNRISGYGWPA